MGYNAPEDRLLPEGYDWKDRGSCRPVETGHRCAAAVTKDCQFAQNDGTVRDRARQTRPDATACRTMPTAARLVHDAATGFEDASGQPTRRCVKCAGTLHVPERDDDAEANLARHPRGDVECS